MGDSDVKAPVLNDLTAPRFSVAVAKAREDGPIELASATSKRIETATVDMVEAVRNAVSDVCRMAYGAFQAANRPDEVVVKFGVELGGKVGGGWVVFVTEATGKATLSFEATWKNSSREPHDA